MNSEERIKAFTHDLIYDFLILMSDESIFNDSEYGKGYIDSLFETYKILYDKIRLFELSDIPAIQKMPVPEEWHRVGVSAVHLD